MDVRTCFLAAALTGALLFAGSGAWAGQRTNPVDVPLQQARSGVELDIGLYALGSGQTLDRRTTRSIRVAQRPTVKKGEHVEVCFQASAPGYVTVWSRGPEARPAVIYPNIYSHDGDQLRGARVEAGQRLCIGNDERFRLRIVGQPGEVASVYLHWTPDESAQLGLEDFPVIGRGVTTSETGSTYASTTIEYRIED